MALTSSSPPSHLTTASFDQSIGGRPGRSPVRLMRRQTNPKVMKAGPAISQNAAPLLRSSIGSLPVKYATPSSAEKSVAACSDTQRSETFCAVGSWSDSYHCSRAAIPTLRETERLVESADRRSAAVTGATLGPTTWNAAVEAIMEASATINRMPAGPSDPSRVAGWMSQEICSSLNAGVESSNDRPKKKLGR